LKSHSFLSYKITKLGTGDAEAWSEGGTKTSSGGFAGPRSRRLSGIRLLEDTESCCRVASCLLPASPGQRLCLPPSPPLGRRQEPTESSLGLGRTQGLARCPERLSARLNNSVRFCYVVVVAAGVLKWIIPFLLDEVRGTALHHTPKGPRFHIIHTQGET